jgi:hypothetical protein
LAVAAFGIGLAANGPRAGVSALLGVLLVSASFAAYVLILGRARRVSPGALQGAVLGGWLLRLGVILGALFAVDAADGDVAAFGFSAIITGVAVATYEAWALLSGRIRAPLELDPAAHERAGGAG